MKIFDKLMYGDFIPDISWKTLNKMAYVGYGLVVLGLGTVLFALLQM